MWLKWPLRHLLRSRRLINAASVGALSLALTLFLVAGSLLDAIALRPLPYRSPDELVEVITEISAPNGTRHRITGVVGRERQDVVRQSRAIFGGVLPYSPHSNYVLGAAGGRQVSVGRLPPGMLEFLGVRPILGREFSEAEAVAEDAVLLGYSFWVAETRRDAGIVGSSILLDGVPYRVIGVAPEALRYVVGSPDAALHGREMWLPFGPRQWSRYPNAADMVARLRPGLTLDDATRELAILMDRLRRDDPDLWPQFMTLALRPFGTKFNTIAPSTLSLLAIATVIVVCTAALNFAFLTAFDVAERTDYLRTHMALGATPGRVAALQVVEAGLKLVAAFGVASWLAYPSLAAVPDIVPGGLTFFQAYTPALNARMVLPALGIIAMLAATAGVVAFVAARRGQGTSPGLGTTAGSYPLARALIRSGSAVQAAAATALCFSAVALTVSFERLQAIEPGFAIDDLVFIRTRIEGLDPALRNTTQSRLAMLPGVTAAGFVSPPPFGFGLVPVGVSSDTAATIAQVFEVTPDFANILGMVPTRGRFLTEDSAPEREVVVSDALASQFWPGQNPIGRRVSSAPGDQWTVVGTVRRIRTMRTHLDGGALQVFKAARRPAQGSTTIVLRTEGDLERVTTSAVESLAADGIRVERAGPVIALFESTFRPTRFLAYLGTTLAIVVVSVTAMGLFGQLSLFVGRRRREFAIRIALGATRWAIGRLVLAEMAVPTVGALLGLALMVGLSPALQEHLVLTDALDPRVAALALGAFAVLLFVCSIRPLSRAVVVDPSRTLRD